MPFQFVARRFTQLVEQLQLTADQVTDGRTKHEGVRRCLNLHYHNLNSDSANSRLVGSWSKSTPVRPPRDIDVLFELPWTVYTRFELRAPGTNKQSALLQEVKSALQATYPRTDMSGDGQVVVIPFTSYSVELLPAFRLSDGSYLICDTNSGGSYKSANPVAEQIHVQSCNSDSNGNLVRLVQMMKAWQSYCNVPLKSFHIELLAVDFMRQWQHAAAGYIYYDWMARDFFKYIGTRTNSWLYAPGTGASMYLGDLWASKATSAYAAAVKACEYENGDQDVNAGWEWRKIFGTQIPLTVS